MSSVLVRALTRWQREATRICQKFEPGDDKEYKVEAIQDSAVYAKETDGHLPGLYYLVA